MKRVRESEIEDFADSYQAEILHLVDNSPFDAAVLPDSFTVRMRISGRGLRDLILNYAYIFEVIEPEDIALPQRPSPGTEPTEQAFVSLAPVIDAPAVCVIDSGIQKGHAFIAQVIATDESYCFLPTKQTTDVGDYVAPGGHGTRVAGAVLFYDVIPFAGTVKLPFSIQNARILDEQNRVPVELFPPQILRAIVTRFHLGPRKTHPGNQTRPKVDQRAVRFGQVDVRIEHLQIIANIRRIQPV
ncbi:MAG: S8 family serine peptidase [Janthinobacterium lividum]